MAGDATEIQGGDDRRRSQHLSLAQTHPPAQVPGYDAQKCLGAGGYGEVWLAVDRNTGRRVAIKFYNQRGGLDWSSLAREVEKLAFLAADRYVVQLIEVGWDADPPYYVMEYIEGGSLQDRIDAGPLTVSEAVALFREVALALVHAHGKGVLHCDLKPANVLLDQDFRPRLADFGQSRLAHEQLPALGTLFYMAPEQADLAAAPDAAWDVYAPGALLYCMLTGAPPYRDAGKVAEFEQLAAIEDRLRAYREWIATAPRPVAHRQTPGVDRQLADLIDRCLAIDPRKRYPNAQAVLDELTARAARRARRPLLVLGALGPALLLVVLGGFAGNVFSTAVSKSTAAVTARALESDGFAAQAYALAYGRGFEQRCRVLERVAADPELLRLFSEAQADPAYWQRIQQMRDASLPRAERERLLQEFATLPLQRKLEELLADAELPSVASWFVTDQHGHQIARAPLVGLDNSQLGSEFWKRDYFHGTGTQEAPRRLPMIDRTYRSRAFLSSTSKQLIAAVSTPIRREGATVGVLAITLALGKFADFGHADADAEEAGNKQLAVLVDATPLPAPVDPGERSDPPAGQAGKTEPAACGQILQHPFLAEIHDLVQSLPPGRHPEIDQIIVRIGDVHVAARHVSVHGQAAGGSNDQSQTVLDYYDPLYDQLRKYHQPLLAAVRTYMASHSPQQQAAVEARLQRLESALQAQLAAEPKWLAAIAPVRTQKTDPRWVVIVQEPYALAVGPVQELRTALLRLGGWAVLFVALVLSGLWAFMLLALNGSRTGWIARISRHVGLTPDSVTSSLETSGLRSPGGAPGTRQ